MIEEIHRRCRLDDLPQVHHAHAIGHVANHVQPVGDEQIGELQLLLKFHQEIEDLGLHRHIEGGHRLVGDEKIRFQRDCPGDADALTLTAGELVGVLTASPGIESHEFHQMSRTAAYLMPVRHGVNREHFSNDLLRGKTGIEGSEGILKDNLHSPAHGTHPPAAQVCYVQAVEYHPAGTRRLEPEQDAPQCGLAAPRFSHQSQCFTPKHLQVYPVHRPDDGCPFPYPRRTNRKVFVNTRRRDQGHISVQLPPPGDRRAVRSS